MYEARQNKEKVSRRIEAGSGVTRQIIQRETVYRKFRYDNDNLPRFKINQSCIDRIKGMEKYNAQHPDIIVDVIPNVINNPNNNGLSVFTNKNNQLYQGLGGISKKVDSNNFGNEITLDNSRSEHRLIISSDGNYDNYIAALRGLNWQVDNS